ncbi:MAG: hypothetical protein F2942_04610 [Actinobacteria bacterium]|uniref:Unannotated protein n=2 Tax=freshwater metagenome TaxID=449393 RepID=A0A6J7UJS1_9ZZZZ|nr:hypothetical protein [Actinomycetota bacterium]MSY22255.1 hypothetical protein [Actinomycetota bacterium]MTA63486.1 hypothetical protein [Actinomycetota bacterium]MTA73980.1 hypothetical protein [Actinomycetota bacterium]
MNSPLRKASLMLFSLLFVSLLASSCSSQDSAEASNSTAATSSTSSVVTFGPTAQTVNVEMPSVAKTLYKVGKDGTVTYGANQLVGSATVLGQPATVEILGSVNYINGSGPFTGFLTVTWADASSIGFSILGTATQGTDGSSKIVSSMDYIGGSGTYVDTQVQGKFTANRTAEVGTPIMTELTLEVLQ